MTVENNRTDSQVSRTTDLTGDNEFEDIISNSQKAKKKLNNKNNNEEEEFLSDTKIKSHLKDMIDTWHKDDGKKGVETCHIVDNKQ